MSVGVECLLNPIQDDGQKWKIAIWTHRFPQLAGYATAGPVAVPGFLAAFLVAAFFRAVFSAVSTLFCAHRRRRASWIAFLPAALSFRLGFGATAVAAADGADSPLMLAHRRCCASRIRRRAAAENFLRLLVGATGVAAALPGPPGSMARSSAILESICRFCSSNPRIAATMISGVSFCIGMSAFRTNHVNAFCGSGSRQITLRRLQKPGNVFVPPRRALAGPDVQPVQLLGDPPQRFAALSQPVNPF